LAPRNESDKKINRFFWGEAPENFFEIQRQYVFRKESDNEGKNVLSRGEAPEKCQNLRKLAPRNESDKKR
jgi:hypothetical protein